MNDWALDAKIIRRLPHNYVEAQKRQCNLLQLTTDKKRPDARRLYERLGFVAGHEGMKLAL